MELPKLMAILGHSNLRSIMKYVHMTQAHIDDGTRKFEAAVLPGARPVGAGQNGKETGNMKMKNRDFKLSMRRLQYNAFAKLIFLINTESHLKDLSIQVILTRQKLRKS